MLFEQGDVRFELQFDGNANDKTNDKLRKLTVMSYQFYCLCTYISLYVHIYVYVYIFFFCPAIEKSIQHFRLIYKSDY